MSAAVLVIWIAVNLKHDGGAEILVWPLAELALFGTEVSSFDTITESKGLKLIEFLLMSSGSMWSQRTLHYSS